MATTSTTVASCHQLQRRGLDTGGLRAAAAVVVANLSRLLHRTIVLLVISLSAPACSARCVADAERDAAHSGGRDSAGKAASLQRPIRRGATTPLRAVYRLLASHPTLKVLERARGCYSAVPFGAGDTTSVASDRSRRMPDLHAPRACVPCSGVPAIGTPNAHWTLCAAFWEAMSSTPGPTA